MYSTARSGPPTTGNGPAATHQTRVAIDWGDANQGSNLMAADSPEFGQFSERVRAVTSPMQGTDFRSASASRHGFHADHLDDLAPPTDEFGEVDPLRFPKRPCLWTHALGEKGDHLRVERAGLGQAPVARPKSRIWRGLTTQSGGPTPARAAATVASKPPGK